MSYVESLWTPGGRPATQSAGTSDLAFTMKSLPKQRRKAFEVALVNVIMEKIRMLNQKHHCAEVRPNQGQDRINLDCVGLQQLQVHVLPENCQVQ